MKINIEDLCLKCLETRGGEIVCPHCGHHYTPGVSEATIAVKPGTLLNNRYLVGEVLGEGGFGITYIGFDKSLHVKLAIKEYFPKQLATRRDGQNDVAIFKGKEEEYNIGLEKFLKEAQTVAKFENHPNIVTVKDFFEINGTAYMVMNYLEGITFKSFINDHGGKIDYETLLTVILPSCNALSTVHQENLLHRDISPDNIYMTAEGEVKLLDFGAARYALGEESHSLSLLLKEGFAPLEQYSKRGNQGPWTDIYAVSATMYRALTGNLPLSAMDRIPDDHLLPPSYYNVKISPAAEDAIMKALSIKIEDRFQSIDEFQAALTKKSKGVKKVPKPQKELAPAKEVNKVPALSRDHITKIFTGLSIVGIIFLVFYIFLAEDTPSKKPQQIIPPTTEIEKPVQNEKAEKVIAVSKKPVLPKYSPKKKVVKKVVKKAVKKVKKSVVSRRNSLNKDLPNKKKHHSRSHPKTLDKKKSRAQLAQECDNRNAKSCFQLAMMMNKGRGGPRNKNRAFELYKKSCEMDYSTACYQLSMIVSDKKEKKIYRRKARNLFKRNCEQSNAYSCLNLSTMMWRGEGGKKSIKEALAYAKKSCELGQAYGCYQLATIWEKGDSVPTNNTKARSYYRSACLLKMKEGCYMYAEMLGSIRGGKKQPENSRKYYKIACKLGLVKACRKK